MVAVVRHGTQADHFRSVTRMAVKIAEEMAALFPDFRYDRDLLIGGCLCHDIGKVWEFDPENVRRWNADPRANGRPSIRHPAFGLYICLAMGLPEGIAHCAAAHSGEGELVQRSLENTILHQADYTFWRVVGRWRAAGGERPLAGRRTRGSERDEDMMARGHLALADVLQLRLCNTGRRRALRKERPPPRLWRWPSAPSVSHEPG